MKEGSRVFYKDFWTEKLKVTFDGTIRTHFKTTILKAYTYLAKLIYLPHLYGYNYNCQVLNQPLIDKIKWDLEKVKNRVFQAPFDTYLVIQAVIKISDLFKGTEVSDSVYLQNKVEEYISLYQADTEELINEK